MKTRSAIKVFAVAWALVLAGSVAFGDLLLGWDLSGLVSAPIPGAVTSTVNDVNLKQSVISRGAGLIAAGASVSFSASSWTMPGTATITDAIASNDYFTFTATALAGATFDVTNFSWRNVRSGTGPTNFTLRTSADNFASDVATWQNIGAANSNFTTALNITGLTQIEFRIYGYTAGSSGGTGRLIDGASFGQAGIDVAVFGTAGGALPVTNVLFTASDDSVSETSVSYTVTVYKTLSLGNIAGQVALGGTATLGGGNDYTIDTTNFTLSGTTTAATFVVTINNDTEVEIPETVILSLTNVTGGTLANPSTFTLTIVSDDVAPFTSPVWVNEINYDPPGADAGEFVEVAGVAGTDLGAYRLYLYNFGTGSTVYSNITLSGTIDDEGCGIGAVAFDTGGIQNGPSDGLALVNEVGGVTTLVQFLSYEGTLTGSGGPADGVLSSDIGSQSGSTTNTLQLEGTGTNYAQFAWATNAMSQGNLNVMQTISPCVPATNTPPVLAAIGNKTTLTNKTLTFVVSATPTDSDAVTLTASNLPGGASFFATNAAGSFYWATPGPAGVYTSSFYAADKDGVASETITITVTSTPVSASGSGNVWINEFHYDNVGGDTNEGVEVAGVAGTDLSNYILLLYNGGDGTSYSNATLSGTIPNETNGYGAIWFDAGYSASGSIQNGPDGIALARVSAGVTTLVQFLSYEGSFVGVGGPANGVSSTDIGAQESGSTLITESLQLCGTGTNYAQIVGSGGWITNSSSHGLMSSCETIPSGGVDPNDLDGDKMPDDWELLYLGSTTNDAYGDVDGDGFPNIEEFVAFTDPSNATSYLKASAVTNGSVNVVVPSVTGRQYRLVTSPLVGVQAWTSVVAGPVSGTGGDISLGVSGSDTTSALRVRVQLP